MSTCEEHGDAIVVFQEDDNCPACKLVEKIDELNDEISDLNKENSELMEKLDEAVQEKEK